MPASGEGSSAGSSTRELLRSLEELRDSLSTRVEALSAAVDRLGGQAGDLERRVGRRQAARTASMQALDLSPTASDRTLSPHETSQQSELNRRIDQHREAIETLERSHSNWTTQEERLHRLLEAEEPSTTHETMEQVLDANRARRAALSLRLSAIRSSLPLDAQPAHTPQGRPSSDSPEAQGAPTPPAETLESLPEWHTGRVSGNNVTDRLLDDTLNPPWGAQYVPTPPDAGVTTPRREPSEYSPDWHMGQTSGDEVMDRLMDDTLNPPNVAIPRQQLAPRVSGSVSELRRLLGARLDERDASLARRSYVDALLSARTDGNRDSAADGDLGVSPFIANLHAYAQAAEPGVDPASSLTLRGQMLQMQERASQAQRLTARAREISESYRSMVNTLTSMPEGTRWTGGQAFANRLAQSSNSPASRFAPAGESAYARIVRLSQIRDQVVERSTAARASIARASAPNASTSRVSRRDASDTSIGRPGSTSWEAALNNWRNSWPNLPQPRPADQAAAQANAFETQLQLLNSGIGGLDVQAIRDVARSASQNLDSSATPRPFSFDEISNDDDSESLMDESWVHDADPPLALSGAVQQMHSFAARRQESQPTSTQQEVAQRRREREAYAARRQAERVNTDWRKVTSQPALSRSKSDNGGCVKINALGDSSTSPAWPSHLPYAFRRARPYVSILDLED